MNNSVKYEKMVPLLLLAIIVMHIVYCKINIYAMENKDALTKQSNPIAYETTNKYTKEANETEFVESAEDKREIAAMLEAISNKKSLEKKQNKIANCDKLNSKKYKIQEKQCAQNDYEIKANQLGEIKINIISLTYVKNPTKKPPPKYNKRKYLCINDLQQRRNTNSTEKTTHSGSTSTNATESENNKDNNSNIKDNNFENELEEACKSIDKEILKKTDPNMDENEISYTSFVENIPKT